MEALARAFLAVLLPSSPALVEQRAPGMACAVPGVGQPHRPPRDAPFFNRPLSQQLSGIRSLV